MRVLIVLPKCLKRDFVPELKNLKKLTLKLCGGKYNCLLPLAFIVNACPNLETLTVQVLTQCPIIRPNLTVICKLMSHFAAISDVTDYN